MSDNEYRFEMQPLYCIDCGGVTGVLGTCDDAVWCERCNSARLRAYDEGMRSGYDLVYSPQEERGKSPMHAAKVPK